MGHRKCRGSKTNDNNCTLNYKNKLKKSNNPATLFTFRMDAEDMKEFSIDMHLHVCAKSNTIGPQILCHFFYPIRMKTKTNLDMLAHVFLSILSTNLSIRCLKVKNALYTFALFFKKLKFQSLADLTCI